REDLRAIVVERRRRIGDEETHLLEPGRIAAQEIRPKAVDGLDGTLAATAHLAQPDESFVGLDFYDGANEATPMAAVGVPKRSFERHGDGRGADVGDLHCDTAR